MQLQQKIQCLFELEQYAQELGCDKTCLFLTSYITIDERIRMKCFTNTCRQYNKNLMCPPFLPSLEDIEKIIKKYTFALLIMLKGHCDTDWKADFDRAGLWINHTLLQLEKKAFSFGFYMSLGLGSGECKLCEICAAAEGSNICHHPGEARPSLEGMGIDVFSLCRAVELPIEFIPGELSAVGLLLID